MKKKSLITLALIPLVLAGCGKKPNNPSSGGGMQPSDTGYADAYMAALAKNSQDSHLYYHYYRFERDFNDWDVWAWPYRPDEGQGVRFDWVGRTSASNKMSVTGDATIDDFGYASIDINLKDTYDGGWNATTKQMGGTTVKFLKDGSVTADTQVGLQIVKSETRTSASGFWANDGGNAFFKLEDFKLKNNDNTYSYHIFVVQDNVSAANATTVPLKMSDIDNPFANDDGKNVTYGNSKYANVNWTDKALKATSDKFLKNAGVGYQIMVASFADSDGDGFGDIYGIQQKLDYLENLGVKVLWLTPIQLSDSYHGYDIADYLKVDPKYGSKESPAAKQAGKVDENTAKADYKALIDAAHAKGMLVVMDLVLNHTSTTNTWFTGSAQLNEALRGYYQWGNHDTQPQIKEENYWYPYGSHVYSYYAKFGSSMPELNYAYVDTRTAVETMALNWCEFGVDGFRMDAVKHIFLTDEVAVSSSDTQVVDVSPSGDYSSDLTKNLNFWKELNYVVKDKYPNAFFVGENFDGHAYHVAPYYEGFDSLFDFYSYFNLTSVASSSFRNGQTGKYTGWLASFLGAYDESAKPESKYSAQNDPEKTEVRDGKTYKSGLKGGLSSVKYGGVWSFKGVMETNNKYRTGGQAPSNTNGYSAINGVFTSNHDIARTINRIAGNEWSASGLEAQGNVTDGTFDSLNTLATLVQITELMLPGLTWIYYGDELGMTGNFDAGKDANSPYADLAYRQPMKWKQGGKVGDGSMTTGYGISGSEAAVKWDSINASTKVADVTAQTAKDADSHYNALAKFAKAKNASQALIRGNFDVKAIEAGAATGQYGVEITRTLGSEVYKFYVNLGGSKLTVYNGNIGSIEAYSAVLTKGSQVIASFGGNVTPGGGGDTPVGEGFGIKINGETVVAGTYTGEKTYDGTTFKEYQINGQAFKAGDTFQLWDLKNSAGWVVDIDGWSFGGTSASDTKWQQYIEKGASTYTVKKAFTGNITIKIANNKDQIYIGLAS